MRSKSSNRIIVCCNKPRNQCTQITCVSSDLATTALSLSFSKATIVSGVDVCSTCRHKVRNEFTKKKNWKKVKLMLRYYGREINILSLTTLISLLYQKLYNYKFL